MDSQATNKAMKKSHSSLTEDRSESYKEQNNIAKLMLQYEDVRLSLELRSLLKSFVDTSWYCRSCRSFTTPSMVRRRIASFYIGF